jgi:hypothetical protein
MARPFATFIGIDLGGARGKSTAVARLTVEAADAGAGRHAEPLHVLPAARPAAAAVLVEDVSTRHAGVEPWFDDVLVDYLAKMPEGTAIAVNSPLTLPACVRCQEPVCPGQLECVDPAVIWLNTVGAELVQSEALSDRDRIAAVPASGPRPRASAGARAASATVHADAGGMRGRPLLSPYTHRCTAVHLRHERQIHTRETLGQGAGPVTGRAAHLRRALAAHGYRLNENLIEVSSRATVHALFGPRKARGYKRDADPWETRAEIVERLSDSLRFAPTSRLSREEVLRNDHCFEAVLSAYTAFLWARDDWQLPSEGPFDADGWIWAPSGPY